jgi:hypothetical protein
MFTHTRAVVALFFLVAISSSAQIDKQPTVRARDLGVPFDGTPGQFNAITDVPGVEVGSTTLIRGDGPLKVGEGPVRTGVTVVMPRGPKSTDPVYARLVQPQRQRRNDRHNLG